ncbi:protein kinase domain-containing protein [Streptomyces tailanensis]|uniref:serine/threonine-protein kinase n=1 Tax=Streptomyces tailanensis TaxID=2569858 RepID=UPI00122E5AB1|nr:PQQ-binding-like beta-propeller repeat protein [Streptomyces tailanensis]
MEPLGPDDPQVLGPYRLGARLGAGGMGRVYLARTPEGRILAVKAIRPELMGDRNFRIRFRREVEAAGAVGGRFTAPVVDADPDGATPWLATEYIAGPTLAEAVAEHGPLPVESVLVLGAGIAEALISVQAAGLVHRDLKPSNVLLAADGPRVIDFGIVRATDGYDLTRSGALFGSFEYMCPEQATGEPLGPEGDIFSLGSVLTYAASGHAPFSGTAAATLLYQVVHSPPDLTGVPDPLDKIIHLCLTKDPRLRITPDKLAAACAPGGVEQMTEDGWLPPPVTTSIALRTAAVETLGTTPGAPAGVPSAGADERVAYANDPVPYAYGQGPDDTPVPRPLRDSGAPYASSSSSSSSSDRPGCADKAPIVADPPGPAPYAVPGDITPDGPASPGHRRGLPRPGPSRRTVLAASAGATAVAVGAALLLTRGEEPAAQSVLPLGPAPKPAWTFRGDPLLQAPAVFHEGTALVKSRPGDMLCLDLKDGTRPKWVYEGISTSATPAILAFDAAVALGEGSTVIGIDPADGTERFTLDFGPDFRFDTLLGRTSDRTLSVLGVRLQRESEDQGNATSTDTVFSVDLAARRAEVIPISPEDVGVRLLPVIIPGYFVYADGLRNVTVRSTERSGVVWRHPVGYALRPGLAVLDRTVFAIGRELRALNLLDGKARWRVTPDSGQFASLGAQGNTVYVTGTNPSGVYAFNAATGTRRWFCPTPRLNVDLPITAGPEALYVPAYKNRNGFYAIDAARGSLLWNFTDGVETGVNQWQLAVDGTGRLVAQHYDRTYGFAAP